MGEPLRTVIASGSKIWLDSIDPVLLAGNIKRGITGATSNPIIIADLVKTGRFDATLASQFRSGLGDDEVAWATTNELVTQAQRMLHPVWERTAGDDGYVSFELDPLLDDPQLGPPHAQRVQRYVELGRKWSAGHDNRMIKVPATPAGIEALEELAAAGVKLNVTLMFVPDQYRAARDAIWRGAKRRPDMQGFKSVYSIFISRVDVYTAKHLPQLSSRAQGQVGILNAKRIWRENRDFWRETSLPLKQEIVFASTGTKLPDDPPDKYVRALAGDGILTNPPETNDAVDAGGNTYTPRVEQFPEADVLAEIDQKVDTRGLHDALIAEGIKKFADPHKQLLELIASKRRQLAAA